MIIRQVAAPAKAAKKEKVVVVAEPVEIAAPAVKETTAKKTKETKKKTATKTAVVEEVIVVAPVVKATKKSAAKAVAAPVEVPAPAPVAVAPKAPAAPTKKTAKAAVVPVAAPSAPVAKKTNKKAAKNDEAVDDGNWLTVPTKSDKKKTKEDGGSAVATKTSSTATTPEKTSKQLKDQSNKAKKEASAAANSPAVETVQTVAPASVAAAASAVPFVEKTPYIVHTVDLASLPSVVAQFPNNGSNTGFEYLLPALNDDRKQADLISKIEEAIGDVVVKPLPPIFRPVSSAFKQQQAFESSGGQLHEKSDDQKLIENNSGVAFDELAGN